MNTMRKLMNLFENDLSISDIKELEFRLFLKNATDSGGIVLSDIETDEILSVQEYISRDNDDTGIYINDYTNTYVLDGLKKEFIQTDLEFMDESQIALLILNGISEVSDVNAGDENLLDWLPDTIYFENKLVKYTVNGEDEITTARWTNYKDPDIPLTQEELARLKEYWD